MTTTLYDEFWRPYAAAAMSPDGAYRYELIRRWGDDPMLEFIMLNPSTADADQDDPTVRRCIGFAKRWGYGALVVRNLYAFRAANPAHLASAVDAFGPENRAYLGNNIAHCTIVGWGAHRHARQWFQHRKLTRPEFFCLGITADGSPRHPLYVRKNVTPVRWEHP